MLQKNVKKRVEEVKSQPRSRAPAMTHPGTATYKIPKNPLKEVDLDKKLKKTSPWYSSIKNPNHGAGAKIPDATGVATATTQLKTVIVVNANAGGIAACELSNPYPNGNASPNNIKASGTTGTSTAPYASPSPFAFPGMATLSSSVVRGSRIVSAGIYAEYEGTALNDQGEFICYQVPFGASSNNWTSDRLGALWNASIVPANKTRNSAASSKWYPISVGTSGTTAISKDYRTFFPNSSTAANTDGENSGCGAPNWAIGIVGRGLNPGSSVRFTFVENLEILPEVNTISFLGAQPSPVDSMEENKVMEWVQTESLSGIVPSKEIDSPASSSAVVTAEDSHPLGGVLGMLGSTLANVLPAVLAVL